MCVCVCVCACVSVCLSVCASVRGEIWQHRCIVMRYNKCRTGMQLRKAVDRFHLRIIHTASLSSYFNNHLSTHAHTLSLRQPPPLKMFLSAVLNFEIFLEKFIFAH